MICVSPHELEIIKDILRQHAPDCEVRAFGSRFKWTNKDYSDLDLAFLRNDGEELSISQYGDLKDAFMESDLPYRVDVVDYHVASKEFKRIIDAGYEVVEFELINEKKQNQSRSFFEWCDIPAEQYCNSVRDGTHDSPKQTTSKRSSYLITSKHLQDHSLDFDNAYRISTTDYSNIIARSKVDQWDVLFSMIGTVGRVYQEKNLNPDYAIKNIGLFKMGGDRIKSTWLKYYLTSPKIKAYIEAELRGSTQKYIALASLRKMPILSPPLETQRSIVSVLSCLDDKIELNNKINANLEAQAQAIFKSWFVDFEPFQDGNFVESELGLIPEGWRVGKLSEIGTIVGGATPSKAKNEYFTAPGHGIGWITPKDLSDIKNKFILHGQTDITKLGFKNASTRLMPEGSVLFSSRAPIGYMAIAAGDICTNQGFKSIVPNENVGTAYVYYTLRHRLVEIQNLGSGSTFKEVSGSIMKNIDVVIPTSESIEEFQRLCILLFSDQKNIEEQNRTLAAIRDALLPKLMSGEIEVPIDEKASA